MPTRKPPPPKADNPEQHRRFVETAREVEADESPDAMDRAFSRVVRPKEGGALDRASPTDPQGQPASKRQPRVNRR